MHFLIASKMKILKLKLHYTKLTVRFFLDQTKKKLIALMRSTLSFWQLDLINMFMLPLIV